MRVRYKLNSIKKKECKSRMRKTVVQDKLNSKMTEISSRLI
jgi:hypothetical protein